MEHLIKVRFDTHGRDRNSVIDTEVSVMRRPFLPPCLVVGALSFFACFNSACMMVETHPKYRKAPLGASASQSKLVVHQEGAALDLPAVPESPGIAIPGRHSEGAWYFANE